MIEKLGGMFENYIFLLIQQVDLTALQCLSVPTRTQLLLKYYR